MTFYDFSILMKQIFEWCWTILNTVKVHFLDIDFYPLKIIVAFFVIEGVYNALARLGVLMPSKTKEETYEEYSRNRFRREKYDLKYNNRHSIRKPR